MSTEQEKLKEEMAKRSSAMMIQMLDAAHIPFDVQLESVLLTLGALFVRNVKREHVKSLFQRSIKKVRDNIDATLKRMEQEKNVRRH